MIITITNQTVHNNYLNMYIVIYTYTLVIHTHICIVVVLNYVACTAVTKRLWPARGRRMLRPALLIHDDRAFDDVYVTKLDTWTHNPVYEEALQPCNIKTYALS